MSIFLFCCSLQHQTMVFFFPFAGQEPYSHHRTLQHLLFAITTFPHHHPPPTPANVTNSNQLAANNCLCTLWTLLSGIIAAEISEDMTHCVSGTLIGNGRKYQRVQNPVADLKKVGQHGLRGLKNKFVVHPDGQE